MKEQFIKKPYIVEAIKWTGENWPEILDFVQKHNIEIINNRGALYEVTETCRLFISLGTYFLYDYDKVRILPEYDFQKEYMPAQLTSTLEQLYLKSRVCKNYPSQTNNQTTISSR